MVLLPIMPCIGVSFGQGTNIINNLIHHTLYISMHICDLFMMVCSLYHSVNSDASSCTLAFDTFLLACAIHAAIMGTLPLHA
jgi:uncharacterized membrane protein